MIRKALYLVCIFALLLTVSCSKVQGTTDKQSTESKKTVISETLEKTSTPTASEAPEETELQGYNEVIGDEEVDDNFAEENYYNAEADDYDEEIYDYSADQSSINGILGIIENNGMERGLVLAHEDSLLGSADPNDYGNKYGYYGFLNEVYCDQNEQNSLILNEHEYLIEDAAKFPEDIPFGTLVTYKGKMTWVDTEKDMDGNRINTAQIQVESTMSNRPFTYLVAYVYESDITLDNNVYKLNLPTNVYVTGMLTGNSIYDNNGNPAAVLQLHSIYRSNGLLQKFFQSIKDNVNGKIYVFRKDAIIILNSDYTVERTVALDQKYTPLYAYYDVDINKTIVGLRNSETYEVEEQTFDYNELINTISSVIDKAREHANNGN